MNNQPINEGWLATLIEQENCRKQLFGDTNPRTEQVKKQQKELSKKLFHTECDIEKLLKPSLPHSPDTAVTSVPESASPSNGFISSFAEQSKEKQSKKKKKEMKRQKKKAQNILCDNLLEANTQSGNLMAEVMKNSTDIILVDDVLYVYQEEQGYYRECDYYDIARNIRSLLDYDDQLKIGSRMYKESYEQLLLSEELTRKDGFFQNSPYVNCLNGVVDVRNGTLLDHSPGFYFKHCIQANYVPEAGKCEKFMEYIECITNGNKQLKKLVRVVIGYLFSHYNNGKKAILVYAQPHTGKSVLCALIERIIGTELVSHVDLAMLQKQEYAASLSGKLLNVAPDLKNEVLKDVGFFKSLVSHNDTIAARSLYKNPKDIHCEAKMLFSTNHLLTFDASVNVYDVEAVFNRLLYIPYQNKPITDKEDNKHLSDELYEERDLIFTWAMKGLREYVENNENFPECQLSEDIKQVNMSRYCPEKVFFQKYIKETPEKYESSSAIKDAFAEFCFESGVSKKADIACFLEEHQRIPKYKKRIDDKGRLTSVGNPIYVYEGIRLKKNNKLKGE